SIANPRKSTRFRKPIETTSRKRILEKCSRKNCGNDAGFGKNPRLKRENLQQIGKKALICLGELDKMVTVEGSKNVANWLPKGEFKLIENFKHPIETVPAEELSAIINNFLSSNN